MCVRLVQNGKHVRSSVLRAAVSIIRYTDFQYVQQYNRIKLLCTVGPLNVKCESLCDLHSVTLGSFAVSCLHCGGDSSRFDQSADIDGALHHKESFDAFCSTR